MSAESAPGDDRGRTARAREHADASADDQPDGLTPGDADGSRPGRAPRRQKRPLYPRLLRLRHVHPNGWQRAALGEGALVVAVVLVLADLASAWTLLVLPLGVALVVKAHDLLAGLLAGGPAPEDDDGAAPGQGAAPEVEPGRDGG